MKFRIDLHVHSRNSGDTDSEPEELIIRAVERDLFGIAFTEHYSFEASEEVEPLKEKYEDSIRIFRGVEFSAMEGHCLIFGVNTDALALTGAPLKDIAKIVNESGGVLIPAHPYRKGNGMGDAFREVPGICAIEGYNGCNMRAYNEKAVQAAMEMDLPITGGSDAHRPEEIGICFTEFYEETTKENLVDLLRKGNYRGVDNRAFAGLSGTLRGWPLTKKKEEV
jgi:hypothetical protein